VIIPVNANKQQRLYKKLSKLQFLVPNSQIVMSVMPYFCKPEKTQQTLGNLMVSEQKLNSTNSKKIYSLDETPHNSQQFIFENQNSKQWLF